MTQTAVTVTDAEAAAIEARVARWYHAIVAERREAAGAGGYVSEWVSFSELRPYVGGYREVVDQVLRRMCAGDSDRAMCIPEANQKTLRQCDRDAALRMGNQWQHFIKVHTPAS